jgi:membrane protein
VDRLKRLGDRFPPLGTLLAVNQRVGELNGGMAAAAITLSVFLSLFPLLLVAIAVVGFLSSNDGSIADSIIENLGLTGEAAGSMRDAIATAQDSRRAASVLGFAGLLWSALGVAAAFSYGVNLAWQATGRGLKDKAVALLWLVGAGVLIVASFALGALLNWVPKGLLPVNVLLGLLLNVGIFLWTFWLLTNAKLPWRSHLPGAIVAAVGFEVLKLVGSIVVPRSVASSSALYGSIGVVFAILAWLIVFGRLIVYSAVLNVIRHERTVGTVSLEIEAPLIEGEEPVGTTRGGAVVEGSTADAGVEAPSEEQPRPTPV